MQRLWRPTAHYGRILSEGRNRPAPSIGSPTFVWHFAIWRKRFEGKDDYANISTAQRTESYKTQNRLFFSEVNDFLAHIQKLGLTEQVAPFHVELQEIPVPGARNDGTDNFQRFEVFLPQSFNFELWWGDEAGPGHLNEPLGAGNSANRSKNAMRVYVQFQSFQDHVSFTFYLDVAQKFDGTQILDADELKTYGARKKRIGDALHAIRKASSGQVSSGSIDAADPIPTDDNAISAEFRVKSYELKDAVDYIYDGVWDEFQAAFDFELSNEPGSDFSSGVAFCNYRGVLMAVQGLKTPAGKEQREAIKELRGLNDIPEVDEGSTGELKWKPSEQSASATLGPVDLFDRSSGEGEVVLQSFRPFLELMSPEVSSRDWVGCGILEGRALFVSPIGSRAGASKYSVLEPTTQHFAERFLVLSKGEPNKPQIGRLVERITSLETMRMFALKQLGLFQNTYYYLRILTFELDNVLKFWNQRRQFLKKSFNLRQDSDFLDRDLEELEASISEKLKVIEKSKKWDVFNEDPNIITDEKERLYYEMLSQLNENIEKKLINITADLETMGPGKGSGHISHDIGRATYFMNEFERLVKSLEIVNLHGWINYEQFADRGMRPTFNMIRAAGTRLEGAQARIKSLTDIIQVSGLIVQSDATRRNTAELRRIASDFRNANKLRFYWWGVLGVLIAAGAALWRFGGLLFPSIIQ